MSWLQEAIDCIVRLRKDAETPSFHTRPELPGRVFRTIGGTTETLSFCPPKHYTVDTVRSFCEAVKRWSDPDGASIWMGDDSVTCLLAVHPQTDSVVFKLEPTFVWELVRTGEPIKLTHARFIELLRTEFYGRVDGSLIEIFRELRFAEQKETDVTRTTQKESLGRSVEKAVHGATDIPEVITVTFVPYVAPPVAVQVELVVTIGFDDQSITLTPRPVDVDTACHDFNTALEAALRDKFKTLDYEPHIYYGNPKPEDD